MGKENGSLFSVELPVLDQFYGQAHASPQFWAMVNFRNPATRPPRLVEKRLELHI